MAALVLLAGGAAFAAVNVAVFELLDTVTPPGTGAEALTWLTTAGASGTAAGPRPPATSRARARSAPRWRFRRGRGARGGRRAQPCVKPGGGTFPASVSSSRSTPRSTSSVRLKRTQALPIFAFGRRSA